MDVTENEILMLGLPFGKVRNVLHMKKKQQAFMELVDEGAAMSVVGYYKSVPATIRWVHGRVIPATPKPYIRMCVVYLVGGFKLNSGYACPQPNCCILLSRSA